MKKLSPCKSIISLLLLMFLAIFICPAHAVSVHAEEIQDSTESVSYEDATANYKFEAAGAAGATAADMKKRNGSAEIAGAIIGTIIVFIVSLSIILVILNNVRKNLQDKESNKNKEIV